jgi:hypothetical protein
MIKYADIKIDQATKHLAAIDRELADLQRQLRRGNLYGMGRYGMAELKAYAALVRERRDWAQLELHELLMLVEMPGDLMGRA